MPEYVKPGQFPRRKYWVHRNRELRDQLHVTFAVVVSSVLVGVVVFVACL